VETGTTTTDPDLVKYQKRYKTFHDLRWDDIYGTKRELDSSMNQVLTALDRNIQLTQDKNNELADIVYQ
jgi:hypothetical protein